MARSQSRWARLGIALVALALVVGGLALLIPDGSAAGNEQTVGSWEGRFSLPLITIHMTVLPNQPGKVLMFSARSTTTGSAAWLWDENSGALQDVSLKYAYDMMCGGSALMANGKVFVAGGRQNADKTSIFDPATSTWTEGPSMAHSRYYPSVIEKGDGKALIFYGQNQTIESYDPDTNQISQLPASTNRSVLLYPRVHLLPDGRIFQAGVEQDTAIFDPAANTWTPLGHMNYGSRASGATVLLPGLNKVMTFGGTTGGGGATKTAEIIDFSDPSPHWQYIEPMHVARQDLNQVLLPDGTVLAVGGKGPTPPKQAELYDPATGHWTLMAAQAAIRGYHSTALLLPDGRVLSAGDGDANRYTGEIYSPPYLFKGPRPTITSVTPSPESLGYGQPFSISTPDAGDIARVALIKPGPVSHGVNFDQRYVDLPYTKAGGAIDATTPANPNLAPPGWYMLFVVNSAGVPSLASWVHVAGAAGGGTCTPATPSMSAVPAQGPTVPAGATTSYTVSVKNNDSPSCPTSTFDLQANAPAGWQSPTFAPPSLTLAPGATGTATMSVTSATGAPPDPYTIGMTAIREGAPTDFASTSVTYTVAPPGGGSGFSDDFNRAALGSSWQVLAGSVFTLSNNELRNGTVVGLHRAVVPTFSAADESAAADFASTSQSTGTPTFGLMLRYQDPTNYYFLYRQAGGSSVLRIAKVVNGVATVLASTGITNPQVNVPFHLSANATGSHLTLTVGTTTVGVNDSTFASGTVGIDVGNAGSPVSYRADEFSATSP